MQPKVHADLLISARWILAMNPSAQPLEQQSIAIAGGRILEVGPEAQMSDRYAAAEMQSRPTHAVLPGFVDASARFESRASVELALAECLRAGITSFAAGDFRARDLAASVSALHLHAVIGLPLAADSASLARSEALWDEYKSDPYVTFCFSPESAQTLDDAVLARLRRVADELDALLSMSLQASEADVRESLQVFRMRPLERFDALGLLRPGFSARQMTVVSDADLDRIASRGIAVIATPQADLRRGCGTTALDKLLRRNIPCAVGSGDLHGKQTFDVLAEARLAGELNALDAQGILELATSRGAQAIGLGTSVGSLQQGRSADLIAIDLDTLATPFDTAADVLNSLAFLATRHQVSDVWLGGRAAVQHGRLLAFDERLIKLSPSEPSS